MLTDIIIVGLITFIVVFMLQQLDGPWGIFSEIRWEISRTDEHDDFVHPTLNDLWDCHWCLGTWVSFFVAVALVLLTLPWWAIPFVWLGGIAVMGLVHKIIML